MNIKQSYFPLQWNIILNFITLDYRSLAQNTQQKKVHTMQYKVASNQTYIMYINRLCFIYNLTKLYNNKAM